MCIKLLESEINMTSVFWESWKVKKCPVNFYWWSLSGEIIMKLLEADNINEAENVMKTEKINEKNFNILRVILNYLYIDRNLYKKEEIWRIKNGRFGCKLFT